MPILKPSVSACTAHYVNPTAGDCGRAPESAAGLFSSAEQTHCSVFPGLCLPVETQEFGGLEAD